MTACQQAPQEGPREHALFGGGGSFVPAYKSNGALLLNIAFLSYFRCGFFFSFLTTSGPPPLPSTDAVCALVSHVEVLRVRIKLLLEALQTTHLYKYYLAPPGSKRGKGNQVRY